MACTVYLETYFELSGNAVMSINFHFFGLLKASEIPVLAMPERPAMGRDARFRDSSTSFSQHARRRKEKRDLWVFPLVFGTLMGTFYEIVSFKKENKIHA